jgi:Undecaprenyl-phosphate galactose phosphotransferase WbaP
VKEATSPTQRLEPGQRLVKSAVKEKPAASVQAPQLFQERKLAPWLLALGDVVALQLAVYLAYLCRLWLAPLMPVRFDLADTQGLFISMLALPVGYYLAGLYPSYGMSPVERFRRHSYVTIMIFAVLFSWSYLFGAEGWPRGVMLIAFGFALVLPWLVKPFLRRWLHQRGYWGTPVVILGAARTGSLIAESLKRQVTLGLIPVAYLDDDPAKWERDIEGIPVLGPLSESRALSRRVRAAVLAMPGMDREKLAQLIRHLPFSRLIIIPDLFTLQSLWVSSVDMNGVLGLEIKRNLLHRHNRLLKRAIDYLLSIPLALLSLPLLAFFALWIKRVSPGPAFYTQVREGYEGKMIRIWKLRTMHLDAEARLEQTLAGDPVAELEWKRFFKLKDDPRILPGVGALLRKTSLDELPQLFNVLRGEMSLVGPRPFPYYHLERFDPEFREFRRSVMPGITGLWQISERSEGDLEVQETLDSYYVRNWSPWLDIYLLLRTISAVLSAKGAY